MKRIKIHRKIQTKNKVLGLEFLDFLILVTLYLLVFLFSKNLFLNLGIVVCAYFILRVYKKGKPPHWTSSVLRFLITPRTHASRKESNKETEK